MVTSPAGSAGEALACKASSAASTKAHDAPAIHEASHSISMVSVGTLPSTTTMGAALT